MKYPLLQQSPDAENPSGSFPEHNLNPPDNAGTSTPPHASQELKDAMSASKHAAELWKEALCTGSKEICHSTTSLVSNKPWHASCLAISVAFIAGWCLGKHINR